MEDNHLPRPVCAVSVSASVKPHNDDDKEKQSSIKITFNFLEREILKAASVVEMPFSYFDRECTRRFQRDTMESLRIPGYFHDNVLAEISSAVAPLLLNLSQIQTSSSTSILVSANIEEFEIHQDVDYTYAVRQRASRIIRRPASKSFDDGLERMKYLDEVGIGSSCVICLEDFENGQNVNVIRLPCFHLYHENCIIRWLKSRHRCPLCRYRMPTNN